MLHSLTKAPLDTIADNLSQHNQELNTVYVSMVLDLTEVSEALCEIVKNGLPKHIQGEGVYLDGRCILPLQNNQYYSSCGKFKFTIESTEVYLAKPIVLYSATGKPHPASLMLTRMYQNQPERLKMFSTCLTPLESANIAVQMHLLERFATNNLNGELLVLDEGITATFTGQNQYKAFENIIDFLDGVSEITPSDKPNSDKQRTYFDFSAKLNRLVDSVSNRLERLEWKSVRIDSIGQQFGFCRIMRLSLCGDQRILRHHINQITQITEMQLKIERGEIEDRQVIEQYKNL